MRKRTKGQQKRDVKNPHFEVCLSVLALAAPLSLEHLTTEHTHFLPQGRTAGGTHQSRWIRHAENRGDKFLQLQLAHVPPSQGRQFRIQHTSSKWNGNIFV